MVDLQQHTLQHSSDRNSASSAIDLTGTPIGLATRPSSPTLSPANRSVNRARRRASWGRVDAGQDPLRLPMDNNVPPPLGRPAPPELILDDPFFSPVDDTHPPRNNYGFSGSNPQYGARENTYRTAQAGQSSASLISRDSETEGSRDDDEARLTSNMGSAGHGSRWPQDLSTTADMERAGGLTPRSRQRTLRYSASPSPLKKTESALRSVSRNIRRVSLRVVNLAGTGLEDSVRLPDDDDVKMDGKEEELPDLSRDMPIRGRTLGCFGPQSRVRLALYNFLVHP